MEPYARLVIGPLAREIRLKHRRSDGQWTHLIEVTDEEFGFIADGCLSEQLIEATRDAKGRQHE